MYGEGLRVEGRGRGGGEGREGTRYECSWDVWMREGWRGRRGEVR